MKLIAWWIGTDALTLVKNPPANKVWYIKLFLYRLKWKILKRFFEHWAVHDNLNIYLRQFGINAKVVVYPADYPNKIKKKEHDGFNILYYKPYKPANLGGEKYLNWYYGYDIYVELTNLFRGYKDIHFIRASLQYNDIDELYAITDCYIRPNRWDGTPRMTQECEIKGIPFYWVSEVGVSGYLVPSVIDCAAFILERYHKWKHES